jgi:hypothetical protein
MKLILKGESINVLSESDLAGFLPPGHSGKALNYGQGEGQFVVSDTIWGFYCVPEQTLVLEEGCGDFEQVVDLARALLKQARAVWGAGLRAELLGSLDGHSPKTD